MHEVETAYWRLREAMQLAQQHHDWGPLSLCFSEDVVFRRPGLVTCHGREEMHTTLLGLTSTFPGTYVDRVEVRWHAFDLTRRRVVHELQHVMRDPGDGQPHYAVTTAMLELDHDGLWCLLEDTFNPHSYRMMYRSWARAAQVHGTLDVTPEVLDAFVRGLDDPAVVVTTPGAPGGRSPSSPGVLPLRAPR